MSVLQGISFSNKELNQDSFALNVLSQSKVKLCCVADGIGSYYLSEVASDFVTKNALEIIKARIIEGDNLDYQNIYKDINDNLIRYSNSNIDSYHEYSLGTTLITCIESKKKFEFSYLGNGAILHLRGSSLFNDFVDFDYLPFVNYLSPHSTSKTGKSRLTRFISPVIDSTRLKPSVFALNKELTIGGDLIIICTDGLTSIDEEVYSKGEEDSLWVKRENMIRILGKSLITFIKNGCINQNSLSLFLEDFKVKSLESNDVYDDTTLVVLMSEQFVEYFNNREDGQNHY